MSERLFSYGTLQLESVQIATLGRMLNGHSDELIGFKREPVEIIDSDVLAKSGGRIHPIVVRSDDESDRVAGMVFEVSAGELAAADAYEVSDYERATARLATGLVAWVYVKRV